MLFYIFGVFLATNGLGVLGIYQSMANAHIKSDRINEVLLHYNLVKEHTKIPLPYVVFAGKSHATWIYSVYCSGLLGGSNAAVIWFTIKIVRTLKAHRHNMSTKTYQMNKQINHLLYIQVIKIFHHYE